MQKPVVHLVDDDEASRSSLKRLLDAMNLSWREYTQAREFLDAVDPESPGCVISEVRLPDIGGLEILYRLVETKSPLPVIFLSRHGSITVAVKAVREGAFHYLEKPLHEGTMWDTVSHALRANADRLRLLGRDRQFKELVGRLGPEERSLLLMVVSGMPNKAIAAECGVCVRTIECRRARLHKKLHVKSLTDLVEISRVIESDTTTPASPVAMFRTRLQPSLTSPV